MKLYLVEIGGMRDGNMFESHEVHPMFASSEEQLVGDCEVRFGDTMRAAHLDGWIEIELGAQGVETPHDMPHFYIIELGRNSANSMREEHDYRFFTAKSWKEAVLEARKSAPGWHVDACVDLDEIAINAGYTLHRDLLGQVAEPKSRSRYVRFLTAKAPA